jgi:hypothetical protein
MRYAASWATAALLGAPPGPVVPTLAAGRCTVPRLARPAAPSASSCAACRKAAYASESSAAALDAQREAALQALAAGVPYRERLAEIAATADSARLQAHTANSRAAAELSLAYAAFLQAAHEDADGAAGLASRGTVHLPAASVGATGPGGAPSSAAVAQLAAYRIREQGLFARAGYSDKQVTTNSRYRLVSAMREAGVSGSEARRAMAQLQPTGRGGVAAARGQATLGNLG